MTNQVVGSWALVFLCLWLILCFIKWATSWLSKRTWFAGYKMTNSKHTPAVDLLRSQGYTLRRARAVARSRA